MTEPITHFETTSRRQRPERAAAYQCVAYLSPTRQPWHTVSLPVASVAVRRLADGLSVRSAELSADRDAGP